MDQDQINRDEWHNPANWSDSIVGLYFSKRDARIWVPKRRPVLGWTLNLAHPAGAWWMVAIIIAAALLPVAVATFILLSR